MHIILHCFLYLTAIFSIFINKYVDHAYMDEVFHYDMTVQYMNCIKKFYLDNFTYWDDKITTPPGLYFLMFLYE